MKKGLIISAAIALCLFGCEQEDTAKTDITTVAGFKVEQLVSTNDDTYGSWVSLAHIAETEFVASDQYGDVYRVTIPLAGNGRDVDIRPLEVEIGKAQGLLWAFNSLYVVVNDNPEGTNGLFRIVDSNNDGALDKSVLLQELNGWGEHGPHGIILGPDSLLYMIAGNHTDLPEKYQSIQKYNWQEDKLFTAILDPNGHARDRGAPGGWIARTDEEGTFWEVYANGFRNAYDIAFNEDGELFTFDSDMEWDLGLPWYRPIRVCHVIAGAEFGWRTGSGKWPAYYPDNLPGIANIGQGSPTGVISAMNSSFPYPYNQGLFICDWSFGTMYHVDLQATGTSYRGVTSQFLAGIPLPITDVAFGSDGAMYFTTGGRRLQSGLFRVTYVGSERGDQSGPETTTVKKLKTENESADKLWEQLGSSDRFVRYAARLAIENDGVSNFSEKFRTNDNVTRDIELSIAMARMGDENEKALAMQKLLRIVPANLNDETVLGLIRAQGLLLLKGVDVDPELIRNQWSSLYPSANDFITEELTYLFAYLGTEEFLAEAFTELSDAGSDTRDVVLADSIAERSQQYGEAILTMKERKPSAHKIALLDAISHFRSGWTDSRREEYFTSFNDMWDRHGGYSYRGFLLAMIDNALEGVDSIQASHYRTIAGADLGRYGTAALANLPVPEGPGKAWTVEEVVEVVESSGLVADYENGSRMFDAALCRSCHQMKGNGSNFGPDLTTLGNRFSINDMAVAIVHPDSSVTDQYLISQITTVSDRTYSGKIVKENDSTMFIMENPLVQDRLREIKKSEIVGNSYSARSLMFPGMLNRLNRKEVFDLMIYLRAGGDSSNAAYNK